jgi:WD40 repeat protein
VNPLAVKAYSLLLGAALAAAGVPLGPGGLTSRAVVTYGHRGAVLDMAADVQRGLLLSVGEDGTLRVWDAGSQTLVRRISVTRQKALAIALDPAAPLAAILVGDGARSFSVDVWNWDTESPLYRIPLESTPYFVRFSLTGDSLLVGTMSWDGLRIFHTADGTPVTVAEERGMAGFAEISRSGSTLMTYRPSGSIEYRDLTSGRVIQEVRTAADLVDVRASDDRRWLVGHTPTEIVCLDAVTGETRLRAPAAGLLSLDVSPGANRIAWITSDGTVQEWSASATPASLPSSVELGFSPRLVRYFGDELMLAGDDGQIERVSSGGQSIELARDILARTSGFAASDGTMALGAGGLVHVFQLSPALSEMFSVASPWGSGPVGLEFLDSRRLLAWPQGDAAGALALIDCSTRTIRDLGLVFDNPLAAVAEKDGRVFTLERGGRIQAVEIDSGARVFQAVRPGAVCISPIGAAGLIVGRVRGGSLESSLVRIDLRTGETDPVRSTETFTYALAPDPSDGSLYSLGVDADGRTKLFRHEGADLGTESVVDSAAGEYLAASLSLDPSSGILYSSLGRRQVSQWSGGVLSHLRAPSSGIQALHARDGLVCSLQRDSTVTLWDAAEDKAIATIFPFSDGSWAAIMADGSVQGTPAGMAKVAIFAQGDIDPAASQEPPVGP